MVPDGSAWQVVQTRMPGPTITLCKLNDLAEGEARGFDQLDEGRDLVFAVRRGNAIRVYRNVCPHQGASLPWRKNAYLNADRTRIVCSAHGAQFDIDSGICVMGPALGQSLDHVDVQVDANGTLMAMLSEDLS